MPITKTEKIWMDGQLVDWDDAKIHVLTHTLHYGCGVFEGIRAYETDTGPAVFRLTPHIKRLFKSAKIYMLDIPFTEDELIAFARAELGGMKAPKSVEFWSDLPRSAVGKVLKREIRAKFWSGRDRGVS